MVKLQHVRVSDDDRTQLEQSISRGKTAARAALGTPQTFPDKPLVHDHREGDRCSE